jgi:inorganic pyrophosphatase/exopolyphosphatase
MYQRDKHHFEEDLAHSQDPNMAYFLAAAVTLDSYNFLEELRDRKWNKDDIEAHKFLAETADVGFEYWKALNDAKFDTAAALDLGLRACFVRDYKKYDLKKGLMGVSVVTASIPLLIDKFGEEKLVEEAQKMVENHKLGIFGIISIHADSTGHLEKGLLIYRHR